MVLDGDVIKAIGYTLITLICLGLSIGIYYQSTQATCGRCLFELRYEGASELLDRNQGWIHPTDMLKDLKENGCELFNKLQ